MVRPTLVLLALALACGTDRPPAAPRAPSAAPAPATTPPTSPPAPVPVAASATPPLLFDAIAGPRRTEAWKDPLPKGALARLGAGRVSDDSFRYLALSHDGRHVATCSFYGNLLLWDAATALPLRPIGKVDHCAALLFARDDRALLAVGFRKVFRIEIATGRVSEAWSLDDGIGEDAYTYEAAEVPGGGDVAIARCAREPEGALVIYGPDGTRRRGYGGFEKDLGKYCAHHVRFSRDGKLMAASDARSLIVFDRASGRELRRSPLFYAMPVAWSDLLYVAMDGAINGLDPATLEAQVSFGFVRTHAADGFIAALSLSGNRLLALAGNDPIGVRLYDGDGAELARWALPYPDQLAVTRDGATALVLTEQPTSLIARIDVATAQRLPPYDLGRHDGGITALAFRADGAELATAAADGTSRTWDPATGAPRVTFAPHEGEELDAGETVAYLADGTLLSAGGECELFRWDPRRRAIVARIHVPDVKPCSLQEVAVAADGRRAVVTLMRKAGRTYTGLVRVLDLETNRWAAPLPTAIEAYRLVPLPAGDRILVAHDGGLAVLDAGTGQVRTTIPLRSQPSSMVLLPRGDAVVIGFAAGGGVDRVPLDGGPARSLTLPPQRRVGEAVALSSDGTRLAISANESVLLYDLTRSRVERTLTGHVTDVEALAFAADGKRLAAGATDGTVLVWAVGGRP